MDEYFQQSGPTPALSVTERRLPAPPMHNGSGHREKLEGRRHLGGFGGGGAHHITPQTKTQTNANAKQNIIAI
jgi:hypothetical protein